MLRVSFSSTPSAEISGPCRLFIVVVRMLRFTTTHPLLPPPWIHYYNNSSSYIVSLCWCVVLTSGCRFIRNSEKDAPLLFVDGAGSMRMNHTYHSPFCTYSFLWFPFFICISFSFGYKIQLWCWNNKHLEIKSRTLLLYFLPYFLRHHDKSAEALDH